MSQKDSSKANTGNTLKAVLDTNILYSGLLYEGLESDLLELGHCMMVRLYVSEYVLDELAGVFERKGLPTAAAEQIISYYRITVISNEENRKNGKYRQYLAESKRYIHDPKDRPVYVFAKTLMEGDETTYLVTGDKDLLDERVKKALGDRVLRTNELMKKIIRADI